MSQVGFYLLPYLFTVGVTLRTFFHVNFCHSFENALALHNQTFLFRTFLFKKKKKKIKATFLQSHLFNDHYRSF